MSRTVRLALAVVLAVAVVGATVDAAPPAAAFGMPEPWFDRHEDPLSPLASACLARGNVITLAGEQARYPHRSSAPDGSGVDARAATWSADTLYPVVIRPFEGEARDDLCLVGGTITRPFPHESTPWSVWHDTAGVIVEGRNFELIDTVFDNVGDGVRFAGSATNWRMEGVRMNRVHDDCVENDGMNGGQIDDSFFDGCYVFYSARGDRVGSTGENDDTVTITDSLVRMEPMPFLYDGRPGPGHGPIFKLSSSALTGRSPRLAIHDTVFRVDQPAAHGELGVVSFNHDDDPDTPGVPYLDPSDCSGNTIVWLGEGAYPAELPDCFEITTDPRVWERAVLDWETSHDVAKAATERVATALIRATCGRIGPA
jgi:hypothetical protein